MKFGLLALIATVSAIRITTEAQKTCPVPRNISDQIFDGCAGTLNELGLDKFEAGYDAQAHTNLTAGEKAKLAASWKAAGHGKTMDRAEFHKWLNKAAAELGIDTC